MALQEYNVMGFGQHLGVLECWCVGVLAGCEDFLNERMLRLLQN